MTFSLFFGSSALAMSRETQPMEQQPLLACGNESALDGNREAPPASTPSASSCQIMPKIQDEAKVLLTIETEAIRDETCFKLGPM